MKGVFVFLFIERDQERVENLKSEIAKYWTRLGGQPDNVVVMIEQGDSEQVADALLDSLKKGGHNLAPTLAFVDP